jgi:hypothetical protein
MSSRKLQQGMQNGWSEILSSFVLLGVILPTIITSLMPSFIIFYFLINIIINLATVFSMQEWGFLYSIGWIVSALLLAYTGILDFAGIVINIIIPIGFMILNTYFYFENSNQQNQGIF